MALQFTAATFKTNNFIIDGLPSIYIELKATLPADNFNIYVGLVSYTDNTKSIKITTEIDNLTDVVFDATTLITEPDGYWSQINNGAIHQKVIELLEARNPDWSNKITKVIPQ